MTTTVVYGDTSDGYIWGQNATYSTARSTATAASSGSPQVGQSKPSSYVCREGFVAYDTSSIPSGDTVSDAVLAVYGGADWSTTDFILRASVVDWGATLTTADWVAGASLAGLTVHASYNTASGWPTNAYTSLTSAAGLPAAVVKGAGAWTRFILWSSRHEAGDTPTGNEFVSFYYAEQAGTTYDPKLTVTHAAAGFPHSQAVVIA
jgi:hypothetical protein